LNVSVQNTAKKNWVAITVETRLEMFPNGGLPETKPPRRSTRRRGPAGRDRRSAFDEFEEMLAVERERAKERQGERTDLDGGTSAKDFTEVERATETAAEKVNAAAAARLVATAVSDGYASPALSNSSTIVSTSGFPR
jgi:hypothetical protein